MNATEQLLIERDNINDRLPEIARSLEALDGLDLGDYIELHRRAFGRTMRIRAESVVRALNDEERKLKARLGVIAPALDRMEEIAQSVPEPIQKVENAP